MGQTIFSGDKASYDSIFSSVIAGAVKKDITLEELVAELRELEADPLVRLADEEEELRECLLQIRKILKDKQARGRRLEAMGITPELINRYRKDYADTDWGC